MSKFKPQLIPNSKTGQEFVLEQNIEVPSDYLASLKHDGGRVEIKSTGPGLSRELKELPSKHLQEMVANIQASGYLNDNEILECEFYSPNMTFSEIMHFFKCSDVTDPKYRKKWDKEWEKTKQGTSTYTKTKNGEPYEQGWEFVGRTPEWLCTWHDDLKLYAFDLVDTEKPEQSKESRDQELQAFVECFNTCTRYSALFLESDLQYIEQVTLGTHKEISDFYNEAISMDEEGIVLAKKSSGYKYGRHTMNSGNIFKLKQDKLEFDGVIIGVEEATEAREGAEKTINELGRSKTSQLKEDRIPSGIAKGFLVRMEDGRELTVSLNDYNNQEKRVLLINAEEYIGLWIRFTGMAPVKHGGMPRQARFTKGNFRDAK